MESIRAFIAIELPEVVRSSLAELQNDLKRSEHAPVKWVAPDSIHLTLKFLGNVDAPKTEPIAAAISQAARTVRPFSLQLGATGAFPNLGAPRVVCVGLGGDTNSLVALHRRIERSLAPLGFSPDKRPFSPHLTLGRVRDSASSSERRGLGEAVSSLKVGPSLAFEAKAVSLMQSTLTRERAIYNCLASAALGKD
jgi:2'-5' RNA ligase